MDGSIRVTVSMVLVGASLTCAPALAQAPEARSRAPDAGPQAEVEPEPSRAPMTRPEDTEIWEPVPPQVAVAPLSAPVPPPSDAIVLFDGDDADEWINVRDGRPAGWPVADGVMTVDKRVGNIETRRRF